MARHKDNKEQQQKAPEHHLCGRIHIIAMNERDKHRRKDNRTRKDQARPLRILRTFEHNRILAYIFIKLFLQNETSSHFAIILIITQVLTQM